MGRRASPGMYAKNFFKVLRLLGVPQLAIAQHLRVQPSAVSMWATGARPIPKRHYDDFQSLVGWTLAQVQQSCEEEHATTQLGHSGEDASRGDFFDEIYNHRQGKSWRELSSRDSPWRAFLRDESLQGKLRGDAWANQERIVALLREWGGELRQEDLHLQIWEECRVLGCYGEWDLEKFSELLHSPARASLERAFMRGRKALQLLDQCVPQPAAEQLCQELGQWLEGLQKYDNRKRT